MALRTETAGRAGCDIPETPCAVEGTNVVVIEVGVQGLLANRYQLLERLGRGAMGEVWRAADQFLGCPVAVKLLHAEGPADAARFRLEAQTAGRLNHPNVVGMYDFGSDGDRLYLVMELVDGWTLAQERSRYGALPPRDAVAIAAQAAAGLAAAHQQGVIHRDVKPANVILTADGAAKIADFGIARFADIASGLTVTGKIVGTADYLAPERALGRPAQPASDVYSLGCVLHELLTGQPPFNGATSLAVVRQHVDDTPLPPARLRPGIPQPLSDYVLRLLSKDPSRRPTAEETAAWLTEYHRTPHQPTAPDAAPVPASAPVSPSPSPSPSSEQDGITPASDPHPRRSHRAARSRPRGHRRLASKAIFSGTGLALFAAAAALGTSLTSGNDEDTPTPPSSPATATPAPAAGAPSPLSAQQSQQEQGKGKGHHAHAHD
ncbi:MAG: serine/threonine protein kinase [Streptomyces sp.]|nr:serine/threonine protein kinase [Streptomyces sp.]NUT31400.1 serine/threonine protein kinase [Streptomyces sp.]